MYFLCLYRKLQQRCKGLHKMDVKDIPAKLLVKPNGETMSPDAAKKFWRTEIGKGSNFNYWYSGALSTVGDKMGWTSDQMWKATEKYRQRFPVAEEWRTNTILAGRNDGFIQLPDVTVGYVGKLLMNGRISPKNLLNSYNMPGLENFRLLHG